MSSNGSPQPTPALAPSHALDVGFASIGNRHHAESSSQAASRSSSRRSSEKRSSGSGSQKREEAKPTQPEITPRQDSVRSSGGSSGPRVRSSGGFLLDSVFANGSPPGPDRHGKRKMQDTPLRVDKRRPAASRPSTESSMRGSPLSQELSRDLDGSAEPRNWNDNIRPSSMDAAQLVQMALNLSESRKRHVSNTLRVPSAVDRRVVSMPIASAAARRRSAQYSEGNAQESSTIDQDGDGDMNSRGAPHLEDTVFYTFTPATLVRAEKARKYFELASEHRRLLDSLPPLKPDAPPSSGRPYNPIQSLRNRRVRIREKRPFEASPDTFADPHKVKEWIDEVESAAKYSSYDTADESVSLPRFEGEIQASRPESRQAPLGPRHKRTETVGSVITRPENSWTIEPIELLADAYWIEQGDNKGYIETRRGDPIFPARQRPTTAATPKISIELHRGRNSDLEHVGHDDDLDDVTRPSRRRRLLLPLATGVDKRRHGRLIRRASDSSNESSSERYASGTLTSRGSVENVGPLEKHMQELIAKEERGELSSPELISPDHWNSALKHPPGQRPSLDVPRRGSNASRHQARPSLEVPRDLHRRARSADGRFGIADHNPIAVEDDDTGSEPGSPVSNRHIPSMGMDLSPPLRARQSTEDSRANVPALPTFQSRNRERNRIGQADFADSSTALSPIFSQESTQPNDGSTFEYIRRLGTNDSQTLLRRYDTGSTLASSRETGSTVGRFLRNRRDRIFRNRDRTEGGDISAGVSDISEAEDLVVPNGYAKRKTANDEDDDSPRASNEPVRPKPKSYLSNLPTFNSAAREKRIQIETPRSEKGDPFSKRSKRLDRLAPSLLPLTQGATSNPDLAGDSDSNRLQAGRKGYGDLQPLFSGIPWHPVAPGAFTPGISQAKRHWSIYDKLQPTQEDNKVTMRDVARVRALLLSSGIKAREIQRRADNPTPSPGTTLVTAAKTVGQPVQTVPLKEEHLVAARLLSTHLTANLTDFESTVSHFQTSTVETLVLRLEDLRTRVSDQLSTSVHDTSDEADAFTVELNTMTPQQTKRVDDAVDEMLRRRRRQFRLFRVAGFKALEWLVLGLLWWIWFLVVVFNSMRKVVVALFRVVRWLCSV